MRAPALRIRFVAEDPYAPIAGLYDFSYADYDEDIDFYENLARAVDGPVLELGAGTGRVAFALAEAGFDVVALDSSPSMLAQARRRLEGSKLEGIELVEGNMTRFDLGRRFGLILVAANTFQHLLNTADQRACLERVAAHLQPGGIFAASVRSPLTVSWDEVETAAPVLLDWTRIDPGTGDTVMKFISAEAVPARMIRRMTYFYDRIHEGIVHRSVFVTELRYVSQPEMSLLLQQVGLRVTHVYGDYDLTPVGQGDNLIFVARAEDRR